jgi:hypothetical protein
MRDVDGSSGLLPNGAQFVCAYEMGFGVDDLPEAVFLVQGETDELWIIRDPPQPLGQCRSSLRLLSRQCFGASAGYVASAPR